ncbi:MAG TPA: small multi-drug export protein [Thermodesulfobacteriota bacterium]|nr:small multi-drug export protein [Thermodesulfobacteriota bacterium]
MEWIASFWKLILVFTLIHFTLGRSFSVLFAIFNQVPVFLYFPLALAYDYVQIPVYGAILEHSSRSVFPVEWLKRKADHVLARMDEKPILKKVMSLGNVGLILLSALPIRGFGILSASIVCFFLRKGRVEGTILLMTGSFIGIFIIMGIASGIFKILALF